MKARRNKDAQGVVVEHKAPVPTDPSAERPSPKRAIKKGTQGDRTPFDALSTDKGRYRLRYQVPSVARHCARILIKNNMDYGVALEEISNGRLDPVTIRTIIENLQADATFQSYVEEELSVHGLDEKSKSAFVREMWDWLRGDNEELAKKAASVLGRGFIGERVTVGKPENLPIDGLGDAVSSMLGQNNEPNPTPPDTDSDELPN